MSARPEPELLENGDILVPSEDGTEVVKLRPGDEGHAEWLAHLQRERRRRPPPAPEPRKPSAGRTAARFGLGFLLFVVLLVIVLVVAALVILNQVSNLNLDIPDLPDLPGKDSGGSGNGSGGSAPGAGGFIRMVLPGI